MWLSDCTRVLKILTYINILRPAPAHIMLMKNNSNAVAKKFTVASFMRSMEIINSCSLLTLLSQYVHRSGLVSFYVHEEKNIAFEASCCTRMSHVIACEFGVISPDTLTGKGSLGRAERRHTCIFQRPCPHRRQSLTQ